MRIKVESHIVADRFLSKPRNDEIRKVKTGLFFSEHRFRLPANGTSPAVGQVLERNIAAVFITADGAYPFSVFLILRGDISRCIFGGFSFDDFMVIRVSHGSVAARNFRADDFAQKDGVGRSVHRADDAAGDIRAAVRDDGHRVAHLVSDGIEFIEIFARAETEGADDGGVGIFGEDGDRKMSAIGDTAVGVVVFVDADHHRGGVGRDLSGAVGGTAGGPAVVPGGNNVDAVGHCVKSVRIHDSPLNKK